MKQTEIDIMLKRSKEIVALTSNVNNTKADHSQLIKEMIEISKKIIQSTKSISA